MSALACPEGYYRFCDIPAILFRESEWNLRRLSFSTALFNPKADTSDLSFSPVDSLIGDLGPRLASGDIQAAAILSSDGALVWVPAAAWRLMDWQGESLSSAIERAFLGWEINIPFPTGTFERGRPIISGRALAEAFGAENPPMPPVLEPCDISTVMSRPDRAAPPATSKIETEQSTAHQDQSGSFSDGPSGVPTDETMDAAQVLSWIAVRRAIPLAEWGSEFYCPSRDWPWPAQGFYDPRILGGNWSYLAGGPQRLLSILESVQDSSDWNLSPMAMVRDAYVELKIDSLVHVFGIETLVNDLRDDIKRAVAINRRFKRAGSELRRALEAGEIRSVGGTRNSTGELMFGREKLESKIWILGVEIFPDGTVREQGGMEIRSFLLFETAEILLKWPMGEAGDGSKSPAPISPILHDQSGAPSGQDIPKRPGGRPKRHDWDAFWIEVAWYAAENDLDVGHRQELQQHMVNWTAQEWQDPPDPATIRSRLAQLFKVEGARKT